MVTVAMILKQLLIMVPTMVASTTVITGAINGAFNIENSTVKHVITWIVAILGGVATVLTGGLTFGLGAWDYLIGAAFGALAGGVANEVYRWEWLKTIIDNIYYIFGNGQTIEKKRAIRAKQAEVAKEME